jgi:hypothetical protein
MAKLSEVFSIGLLLTFFPLIQLEAYATESCNPTQEFIGFSMNLEIAYWETQLGGDCDPETRIVAYHFSNHAEKKICTGESLDSCKKQKQKIQNSLLVRPQPFLKTGTSRPATVSFSIVGKDPKNVSGFDPSSFIILKDGSDSCRLKKFLYADIEEDAFPAKKVREAFYNQKFKSWVLITEHCYSAAMAGYTGANCPTIDGISISDVKSCEK